MEKEKLISRLNIKDYNNQLEKILSKKTFSEDTKNLLLSMLYKIENSYDDYNLVNVETKTKKETLEEILRIIQNNCDKIEIIKTKESKAIPSEKKIITYLNTKKMLYEIYQLDSEKFKISEEYSIIKPALEQTLNQGYSIASNEIIRDFDGWSWNIVKDEIENIKANLIYQILKILVGYEFLSDWKKSKNENYIARLIYKLEKEYSQELGGDIFKKINQIAILNVVSENKEEKNRLVEIEKNLEEQFKNINDKEKYINNLWEKKKKIAVEIKKIDNILKNDKKLKEEFILRNQVLDINNRIFSLSDLAEILEGEKEVLVKKINKYNKEMEPINFIKTKVETQSNLALLKEINLQNENERVYNAKVKELLNLVLKAINIQIDNTTEKDDLIKLIYKVRYFSLIYVNNKKQIKDLVNINTLQKLIITKTCKQKAVTIFSRNIKENYDIIKNMFETDIIELEKIYFKFIQKENGIVMQIYDEDNMLKEVEFDNIEELNIKLNKKIKVFI